ncbi:MAG: hypothetical protein SVE93_06560 [Candidatus Thermoplasmatota archaeon]|nr:hypothetical protein [Candidatus Thermoplasmatota archaeon]
MVEEKMISMDDAEKIAKDYVGRQIGGYQLEGIVIDSTELVEAAGVPIYSVEGKATAIIKEEKKQLLKVIPAEKKEYSFKVQVHAIERTVTGHKLY